LEQKWPQTLWIVRHGQSAGNVARDAAELGGLAAIDIADRDVDVPLSPLGEHQADALGDWFAGLPPEEQPEIVLSSPYVRACQTGDRVLAALHARGEEGSNGAIACVRDERLREKEFGILDRLTPLGIRVNAICPGLVVTGMLVTGPLKGSTPFGNLAIELFRLKATRSVVSLSIAKSNRQITRLLN
jgi:hypothetical protein